MSKHHTSEKVKARIAKKKEATALIASAREAADITKAMRIEGKCGHESHERLLTASIACEIMTEKGFRNLKGIAGIAAGLNILDVIRGATPELSEMAGDFENAYTPEKGANPELMEALKETTASAHRVVWLGNTLLQHSTEAEHQLLERAKQSRNSQQT